MELTKEVLEELAKPFPAKDIGLKPQSTFTDKATGNLKALVVPFIDARDVIKRLNAVVGGEWYDTYRKGESGGLECTLTVCGVPRPDIGNDDNVTEAEKSAYSDSFKRAAVKFNIGLFLYDMPKMYAEIEEYGKTKKGEPLTRITRDEESRLRGEIARFLKEPNAPAPQPRQQSAGADSKPSDKPKEQRVESKIEIPRSHPPLSPVQKKKLLELYRLLHPNDDDAIIENGLDALFIETFNHPVANGTYEEGARLTGQLLSEIRKNTETSVSPENKAAPTNGNGDTAPKPTPTERGGLCSIHNEPTHEYKKTDGTTFWGHKHENENCFAKPKPETIVKVPGGVK